jgi:general secretion pathway protein L
LAGDAVIHLDGDDALLRWGDAHASRVQSDLLPKMATLIAAELEDDEPLGVTIVYDEDRNDELAQARLGSELQEIRPVDVRFETQTVDLFQRLCKRYRSAAQSINLLQGEFQPVRRRGEAPLARFAWAAVLLVAWIAVDLGINVTQAILLDRETDRLETEAVALYRSWFPEDRRVTTLNIRDRTMAHIKTGTAQTAEDEFFVLLSALARELSSRRGANVQSINYSESAGQLTLELSADGYSTVEGITNALQANGVNVEIASARQEEERVLANLRLQRG